MEKLRQMVSAKDSGAYASWKCGVDKRALAHLESVTALRLRMAMIHQKEQSGQKGEKGTVKPLGLIVLMARPDGGCSLFAKGIFSLCLGETIDVCTGLYRAARATSQQGDSQAQIEAYLKESAITESIKDGTQKGAGAALEDVVAHVVKKLKDQGMC